MRYIKLTLTCNNQKVTRHTQPCWCKLLTYSARFETNHTKKNQLLKFLWCWYMPVWRTGIRCSNERVNRPATTTLTRVCRLWCVWNEDDAICTCFWPAQNAATFSRKWNRTTSFDKLTKYVCPSHEHATTSSVPSPYSAIIQALNSQTVSYIYMQAHTDGQNQTGVDITAGRHGMGLLSI